MRSGPPPSLGARRAMALGDLARTQTALDLHTQGSRPAGTVPEGLPVAREVVLHAHFAATTEGGTTVFGPTGRLEEGQRLILLDQVKGWCADSRTRVTIRPVIDLTTEHTAPGYAIPDRVREQIVLRDGTCVFPWCSRPARVVRCGPRRPLRPPRRRRGQTPARTHDHLEPRGVVPASPPAQDPHRLALHRGRSGRVRVDQPPRPPLPPRPLRHPPRSSHPSRQIEDDPAPHPATHLMAGPQACAASHWVAPWAAREAAFKESSR